MSWQEDANECVKILFFVLALGFLAGVVLGAIAVVVWWLI